MRIDSTGITIETNATFEEQEFSIGDPSLIMEHLRKTIYSNPIKAICQELMSNARDAHRELGLEDVPIKVKLPNALHKTWECQDFGPGIDPKRMIDVFIKFGNSTKRGSGEFATDDGEKQTGGFGVGAKTPWAYTDSFTILTRAMENDRLVERTYIALIAEDRKNKLMEMEGSAFIIDVNDESIPKENRQTGTTIIVDVQKDDFHDFYTHTVEVSRFWDVKPQLSGCDPLPEFKSNEMLIEGEDWGLLKGGRYDNSYAIVDGIPYRIEPYTVSSENVIYNILHSGVVIHFKVNQLSLPLSREALQYDEKTKEAIIKKCYDIHNELGEKITESLTSCTTLKEAIINFTDLTKSFNRQVVGDCSWTAPDGKVINLSTDTHFIIPYLKDGLTHPRKYKMRGGYISSTRLSSNWIIGGNDIIIINNDGTKNVSRLKLETLFDQYPDYNIVVIQNEKDLIDYLNNECNLQYLEPLYSIDIVKKVKPRTAKGQGPKTAKTERHAHVFNPGMRFSYRRRSETNYWNSSIVDIVNGSGLYVEVDRKCIVPDKNNCQFTTNDIYKLVNEKIITDPIYGIPSRFIDKLGPGWVPLRVHLENLFQQECPSDYIDNMKIARYVYGKMFNDVCYAGIIPCIMKECKDTINPDSFLYRFYEKSIEISKGIDDNVNSRLNIIITVLGIGRQYVEDDVDDEIKELFNTPLHTINTLYPLIASNRMLSGLDMKTLKTDAVEYINSKNNNIDNP